MCVCVCGGGGGGTCVKKKMSNISLDEPQVTQCVSRGQNSFGFSVEIVVKVVIFV